MSKVCRLFPHFRFIYFCSVRQTTMLKLPITLVHLALYFVTNSNAASYGESCAVEACDFSLYCDPGSQTCVCPGQSFWNPDSGSCFILSGDDCVQNPTGENAPCIPGAVCTRLPPAGTHKCLCRDPLKETASKLCHLMNNIFCRREQDLCDPEQFLFCGLHNRCTCGKYGKYDETLGHCILLPGGECSDTGPLCIDGTSCSPIGDNPRVCLCQDNLAHVNPIEPETCYLHYGQQCGNPGEANCDPHEFLFCAPEGQCKCVDENVSSEYDKFSGTCRRLAAESCEEPGMACVAGAYCNLNKTCTCHPPLKPSILGQCFLDLSSSCRTEKDFCNPEKFLSCSLDGNCTCGNSAFYDESKSICILYPGSLCNSTLTQECGPGSSCVLVDGEERCACGYTGAEPNIYDPRICTLSHKEGCDESDSNSICDHFEFLTCQAGLCLCNEEANTIFDNKTNKCMVLADRPCNLGRMSCVPTASCVATEGAQTCQCRPNLTAEVDGFCYLGQGSSCLRDNDLCNPFQHLTCNLEGKCSCGNAAYFDEQANTCLYFPGSLCNISTTQQCAPGSRCSWEDISVTTKCLCEYFGAEPNIHDPRICTLSHNETCDPESICDPFEFLECRRGHCICGGKEGQTMYDTESRTCMVLADNHCDPEGMTCVPTASCQNSSGLFMCQCRPNLVAEVDGLCYLSTGASCLQDNDLCNPHQYLTCNLEGKCSCDENSFYDEKLETCFIFPGSSCNISSNQDCAPGSKCSWDGISINSKCLCSYIGAEPNSKDPRICTISHNRTCDNNDPASLCDPFEFLSCKGGHCLCENENGVAIYDKESKTCMTLAQYHCNPDGMTCIPSASCMSSDGEFRFRCQCHKNLTAAFDGHCYLSYDASCLDNNDLCNIHKFLSCNVNGKCWCGENAYYNATLEMCLLLPEQPCGHLPTSQPCAPTSPCSRKGDTCECPRYSKPSDLDSRMCAWRHGDDCREMENLCDPLFYLECSEEKRCTCSGNNNTWYSKKADTCFLKADEPCEIPDAVNYPPVQKCTPNSDCLLYDDQPLCTCRPGFIKNRDGLCFLPHQSPCLLSNDLCDPSAFLSCSLENKCWCGKEAIFNYHTNTCLLLGNASCTCLLDDGSKECVNKPKFYPNMEQPCIRNAKCDYLTGICLCLDDLKPNQDRLCFSGHGVTCDRARDLCNPKDFLECDAKLRTCVCEGERKGTAIYSAFQKKCYLKAESPCGTSPQQCVPNAFCSPLNKTCKCFKERGFKPNIDGICFLPFATNCSTENDLCDRKSFLECGEYGENASNQTICKCQRGYETFYDHKAATCRLIHDRPCTPPSDIEHVQLCDGNAKCLPVAPGNHTHRCVCNEFFTPNKEKICFLEHRRNCSGYEEECDPLGPLTCRKRGRSESLQCQCRSELMEFNGEKQVCLSFPGEECSRFNNSLLCIDNAFCSGDGICLCNPGFEYTHKGSCKLRYGEPCFRDEEDLCNDQVNLKCRSGMCLCKEEHLEHDWNNRTICIPSFNVTCEEKKWPEFLQFKCSPEAFLRCDVSSNTCICHYDNHQAYVATESQCRSTVGMECDGLSKFCVPGANCTENYPATEKGICMCNSTSKVDMLDSRFCVNGACTNLERTISMTTVGFILWLKVRF